LPGRLYVPGHRVYIKNRKGIGARWMHY